MKRLKSECKKNRNIRLFASAYLSAVSRNLEYIQQIKQRDEEIEQLKSSNTVINTEPGKRKYLINMRLYTNPNELIYDLTDIIQLIQFESPELLVKILRQIHHNYSVMNISEMTTALNKHEFTLGSYSESIPNELYILKVLADSIATIKEMPNPFRS